MAASPLRAGLGAPPPAPPPNVRLPSILGRNAGTFGRTREVGALLLWAGAVFVVLALLSYAGDPMTGDDAAASITPAGPNWVGPVGEVVARLLVTLAGVVAWA